MLPSRRDGQRCRADGISMRGLNHFLKKSIPMATADKMTAK
jgi:hypothetical protein